MKAHRFRQAQAPVSSAPLLPFKLAGSPRCFPSREELRNKPDISPSICGQVLGDLKQFLGTRYMDRAPQRFVIHSRGARPSRGGVGKQYVELKGQESRVGRHQEEVDPPWGEVNNDRAESWGARQGQHALGPS